MRYLNNWTIVNKIGCIIWLFGFIFAGSLCISLFGLQYNDTLVQDVLGAQEPALYTTAIASERKTRLQQLAFALANEADPSRAAEVQKALNQEASDLNGDLDRLKGMLTDPADFAGLQPIFDTLPKYMTLQAKGYEMMRGGQIDAYRTLLRGELTAMFEIMDKAFDTLNEEKQKDVDAAKIDLHASAVTTLLRTLVVSIGGFLLAAATSLYFTRQQIGRPLAMLTSVINRLVGGDISIDVPELNRHDEIGAMSKAVQVFKDNALRAVAQRHEVEQTRRQFDSDRQTNEGERIAVGKQQAQVVNSIASGLHALASGQLTFRIVEAFAPDYEKLRHDFNGAMEKLQDTMKIVSANTSAIQSGTGEISSASDDLSRRTEQQAASLEQTAAALDEITATVRKTAEGSKHARDVVGQAKQAAEHSGRVVRQAVEAMSGIERSAGQIGNIIGVIDEIAFQTNLLALNAGVEAARAGDAGRGFAVVASEVRALAQRSADAAKEIKTLISASSHQVEQGVDLVGQTGRALETIVAQVTEINGIVADIAASAQEQATGLDQVNTAVNQMDQVTQQNAAMVEESTAASHALAQETEELARLIGQFETGERSGAAAPIRAAVRPARAVSAPKPVAAMKTVGRGGAARKPASEAADWQEF